MGTKPTPYFWMGVALATLILVILAVVLHQMQGGTIVPTVVASSAAATAVVVAAKRAAAKREVQAGVAAQADIAAQVGADVTAARASMAATEGQVAGMDSTSKEREGERLFGG